MRALVTAIGLGANRPQDAIYPVAEVDADSKPFDGANRYVMHLPAGQLPPVDGFWSLTMYDGQYFFVPNKLNRYTLSARNPLKHNGDGRVDLYLQASSPGAAKGGQLAADGSERQVHPDAAALLAEETPPSILDGTSKPPPVARTLRGGVGNRESRIYRVPHRRPRLLLLLQPLDALEDQSSAWPEQRSEYRFYAASQTWLPPY